MSFGAIAGSHEKTIESAENILRVGGNAFDAVISACLTMFATEPCMASAGAGGFAMCHSNKTGTQLLDFFAQTPIEKDLERNLDFDPLVVDFGTEVETFYIGKASIAVPGIISGLFELHRTMGTIPMRELAQHAKHISKTGVVVDDFGEVDMYILRELLYIEPSVRDIFFNGDQIKRKGEILIYPNLADFLDFLIDEEDKGFYLGEMGAKVSRDIYEAGGFITRKDFESYKARWADPMQMPFLDQTLCLPNGPSLGGAILALLDHFGAKDLPLTEVLKTVKDIHSSKLIEPNMEKHLPNLNYQTQVGSSSTKGTTHISVVDKDRNSIALTISLGEGSGYWIPGTDMQLNNMLGETFLLPGGHHSWHRNQRLNSMMTPVIVKNRDGKVTYAGGSGGAGRIPYVIYQTLEAVFKKGLSLEEATLYPRMHWHEGVFQFEEGADLEGFDLNQPHRSWEPGSLFFGGVHSVRINDNNSYEAIGDPRRFGLGKVLEK